MVPVPYHGDATRLEPTGLNLLHRGRLGGDGAGDLRLAPQVPSVQGLITGGSRVFFGGLKKAFGFC